MKIYGALPSSVLVGLAARELAGKLNTIEHLNITPELLGGGRTIMISMLVARNVELYFEWGAASSVAIVLLVIVLAVFWVLNRFLAVERVFGSR